MIFIKFVDILLEDSSPVISLTLFHRIPTFKEKALENNLGKGENAGNIFPKCFLLYQIEKSSF